ncbi:MAG: hypothetical protein ABW042_06765 [Phenylobacterium sp.]
MASEAEFGFRIEPCGEGWSWRAYDAAGKIRASGAAPTKAAAAAHVIHEIARAPTEADRADAA